MIPRILWHMGSGILRRKLSPPVPGALLRWPGVWKSRASLRDCNFSDKLVENAYFRNMELAIWYGCGLQGILHICLQQRWYFVFGSQGIRHYADIKRGQPFEVHTTNVHWDDDWFFLHAQFKCPDTGELFAEGLSRVMLRQGRERIDSRRLYELMGVHGLPHSPEMPAIVKAFLGWDAATETDMKLTAADNERVFGTKRAPGLLTAHSMNLPLAPTQIRREETH